MKKTVVFFIITAMLISLVPTAVFADDNTAETVSAAPANASALDKAFGTFTIVVMSIGILGLPAYFWLNSRKKRLLAEYEEQHNPSAPEEDASGENTEE